MADVDLALANEFMWRNARLIDRLLFAHRFLGGSSEVVVHALRPYQNDDGGFGNALEPDLRGPISQPIHVDMAFRVLHDIGLAPPELVARACTYLSSVSGEEGGVPAILPNVARYPRAEHWQPNAWIADALNPTAMLAGLLHALHVGHSWLDRADAFCWKRLGETKPSSGPDLAAVYCFLNHAPDKRRAVQAAEDVADAIPSAGFFALDPEDHTGEYALTPLHLAPTPDSMAAALFAPELLDAHLDHLVEQQQEDGGWSVTWDPPGDGALLEWRGRLTLEALTTLQNYNRI
ncbi:MAG TPA: hypothetical protein VGJ03_15155 [Acidimicrobiales bacterium]